MTQRKGVSLVTKERDETIALEAVEEYLNNIDWINDEIRATLNYAIEAMISTAEKHESRMFKIVMAQEGRRTAWGHELIEEMEHIP